MSYTVLTSEDELAGAFSRSNEHPVLVFKHSLTCPVSSAALREYEKFLAEHEAADATLIEVQRQRPLSNAMAERTGVQHESPQAFVLEGGEVSWHASHWNITAASLGKAAS